MARTSNESISKKKQDTIEEDWKKLPSLSGEDIELVRTCLDYAQEGYLKWAKENKITYNQDKAVLPSNTMRSSTPEYRRLWLMCIGFVKGMKDNNISYSESEPKTNQKIKELNESIKILMNLRDVLEERNTKLGKKNNSLTETINKLLADNQTTKELLKECEYINDQLIDEKQELQDKLKNNSKDKYNINCYVELTNKRAVDAWFDRMHGGDE